MSKIKRFRHFKYGYFLLIFVALLSPIAEIAFSPPLAQAAFTVPSDAKLIAQGKATAECKRVDTGGSDLQQCAIFYKNGYKSPNTTVSQGCKDSGIVRGLCNAGYPKGQADRKTAEKESTQPARNSSDLSDNEIRNLAKNSTQCKRYNTGAVIESCVDGYVAGYKGTSKSTACSSRNTSSTTVCEQAYAVGQRDKQANVTNQSQQTTTSTEPAPTADSGEEKTLGCDASINPLTWIICPIVEGLAQVVEQIDNLITKTLEVDTSQIFCSNEDNCKAYRAAWANFRNIALGLLIIVGMTILIAQALGMEILDAYVIRKTLPRFIIAAIAITLSWALMEFAVEITNALGYGVRFLIYAPFNNLSTEIDLTFGGSIIATFFTVGALGILGIFGLLSYALTALIAVFVAVLVLVLREIIITAFIILAPIALVMYVLPNTNRVFKFWWSTFIKLLLMFPIIAGLIAAGRVFAAITLNSSSGGPLANFIAFAAYFAPYFMIPFVFSFVGGAIAQIGGFINDRSKGLGGGLRSYRGNKAKQNMADFKSGRRLRGEDIKFAGYGKFAKRFNAATRGAAEIPHIGYNPNQWRNRYRSNSGTRAMTATQEAREKNAHYQQIRTDDDLVEAALLYDTDQGRLEALRRRGLSEDRARQGVGAIKDFQKSVDAEVFDRAMLIAASETSSGFMPRYDADGRLLNEDAAGGSGQLRDLINKKMGTDRQSAIQVLGGVRQGAESKGRWDLVGGSFTEDAMMLEENAGKNLDGAGIQKWTKQIHRNALDGQSRQKVLSGHNRAVQQLMPEMGEMIREKVSGTLPSGEVDSGWTESKAIEEYAFMASTLDPSSYASPEIARQVSEQLRQTVDVSSVRPELVGTIREAAEKTKLTNKIFNGDGSFREGVTHADIMEALRGNDEFATYRREYGRGDYDEDARRRRPEGT